MNDRLERPERTDSVAPTIFVMFALALLIGSLWLNLYQMSIIQTFESYEPAVVEVPTCEEDKQATNNYRGKLTECENYVESLNAAKNSELDNNLGYFYNEVSRLEKENKILKEGWIEEENLRKTCQSNMFRLTELYKCELL